MPQLLRRLPILRNDAVCLLLSHVDTGVGLMPNLKITSDSPEKSKAEIVGLLREYGADQLHWTMSTGRAAIAFRCQGRFARIELVLPSLDEDCFWRAPKGSRGAWCTRNGKWGVWRTTGQAAAIHEQEVRRLWRAFAVAMKAKFAAVEAGVTTFEHEFLACIVLPDGSTVADHVIPAIADAYSSGMVPRLLPGTVGKEPS